MNTYKFIAALSALVLAACSDSTSASSDDVDSSSSQEISSSSEAEDLSSSSVESSSSSKKQSPNTGDDESSSSSEKKKSNGSESSSSSQKELPPSSASEILTDPLQIFKTRVPEEDAYTCKSTEGETAGWVEKFDQRDWICSFRYGEDKGYVYVQSTPYDCETRFSMIPEMSIDTAILYVNEKYVSLDGVTYDWGGNHHNESFRFAYGGKVFEYFYSTFGWGGRSCQEMDCLVVYDADGKTLIEDGCGLDNDNLSETRKLPVICRFANVEDGSFGRFIEEYDLCLGDYRRIDDVN